MITHLKFKVVKRVAGQDLGGPPNRAIQLDAVEYGEIQNSIGPERISWTVVTPQAKEGVAAQLQISSAGESIELPAFEIGTTTIVSFI